MGTRVGSFQCDIDGKTFSAWAKSDAEKEAGRGVVEETHLDRRAASRPRRSSSAARRRRRCRCGAGRCAAATAGPADWNGAAASSSPAGTRAVRGRRRGTRVRWSPARRAGRRWGVAPWRAPTRPDPSCDSCTECPASSDRTDAHKKTKKQQQQQMLSLLRWNVKRQNISLVPFNGFNRFWFVCPIQSRPSQKLAQPMAF